MDSQRDQMSMSQNSLRICRPEQSFSNLSLRSWRFWSHGIKSLGGKAARGKGRQRLFFSRLGSTVKTFDPAQTKPPATQAIQICTYYQQK